MNVWGGRDAMGERECDRRESAKEREKGTEKKKTTRVVVCILIAMLCLNTGRVKHHTNGGTNRLRGKRAGELGLHNTVSTMSPAHLSPVDLELGSVLSGVRALGNVSNLLSKVEVDGLLVINTRDLDEGGVVVLVPEATLETKVDTLDVKAGRLGGALGHFICIILRLEDGGGRNRIIMG